QLRLRGFEPGVAFVRAVARPRRAAGLRDHDAHRFLEPVAETREHGIDAVGIGVVEERRRELVAFGRRERARHELRAERRAADADDAHVGEAAGAVRLTGPGWWR